MLLGIFSNDILNEGIKFVGVILGAIEQSFELIVQRFIRWRFRPRYSKCCSTLIGADEASSHKGCGDECFFHAFM